ncbi:MAG: hypothetical protein IPH13_04155 [Planctomycetes bacterium]|nr:hypothetical protein [Planctomycetota bacterium]MCC7172593.1 hypothetical protein [Planctomycetota bacterium]
MRRFVCAIVAATLWPSSGGAGVITVSIGQSIQGAIAAAADDDVVLVGPGQYNETITIVDKRITLRGVAGAANTFVDGAGSGTSVVRVEGTASSGTIIDGFTFRGGEGGSYGFVTTSSGGGLFVIDAGITVRDCAFSQNRSNDRGGGAYVYSSTVAAPPVTRFEHCSFIENRSNDGGGFAELGARSVLAHCSFVRNQALAGGGAHFGLPHDSRVEDCSFVDNRATLLAGGGISAILAAQDLLTVTRSTFVGNFAGASGGGISMGTIGVVSNPRLYVLDSWLVRNTADHGGGIGVFSGMPTVAELAQLLHVTIADNVAFGNGSGGGAGVNCSNGARIRIDHSIIEGNVPNDHIVFLGTAVDSLIKGGVTGPGVFAADPQFVDRVHGDYHLSATSVCRDQGKLVFAPTLDVERDARAIGTIRDLGADEFHPHLYGGLPDGGDAAASADVAIRAVGTPGGALLVFVSAGLAPSPMPTSFGSFALSTPVAGPIAFGTLDGSGSLDVPFAVSPAFVGVQFAAQGLLGAGLTNAIVLTLQ